MAQEATNYVPGICNINTKEVAQRRKAGYFGLVLTVLLTAVIFALNLNRYVRLLLFVPLFVAAIGFLQAKNKFCVGYGAAGLQNAEEHSENATHVADAAAVAKDKKRTHTMYAQAILLSLLTTAVIAII